jgi:glycolate oxidase iron-sulfur subunit
MFPHEKIENLKDLFDDCVKCGMCQSVCPVFQAEGGEENSSRGRLEVMKLIASGELPLNDYAMDLINRCVGCTSCEATCRNGVEYLKLLAAFRRDMNQKKGASFVKKITLGAFAEKSGAVDAAKMGSFFTRLLSKLQKKESGLKIKFPFRMPGVGKGVYIPPLADEGFIEKYAGEHKAEDEWTRLGFFVGCSSSFILPEIAEAMLGFLTRNGVTVIVPEDQGCCGTPHYISGDSKTANRLLTENEVEFSRYDIDGVITGCATCGGGLKEFYNLKNKSSAKLPVYDFNEFVINNIKHFKIELIPVNGKVTWHDPCHLARLQKIKKQPRDLVRMTFGENFEEMEKPDSCCGFGGVFAAANPGTALKIAKEKAERIEKSGAKTVVTSCPGCVLFLRLGAAISGGDYKVLHISQVL